MGRVPVSGTPTPAAPPSLPQKRRPSTTSRCGRPPMRRASGTRHEGAPEAASARTAGQPPASIAPHARSASRAAGPLPSPQASATARAIRANGSPPGSRPPLQHPIRVHHGGEARASDRHGVGALGAGGGTELAPPEVGDVPGREATGGVGVHATTPHDHAANRVAEDHVRHGWSLRSRRICSSLRSIS